MRYLLRNVVREAKLDSRRRAHPNLVNRRPMIGGKPLPPEATRFLMLPDFTPVMLNEIEDNQEVGNVQLLMVGRDGGEVSIPELRKQLGFPQRETLAQVVVDHIKSELKAAAESDGIPEYMKKTTNFKKIEAPKVEVKVGDVRVAVSAGEDETFGTRDDVVEVTPSAASKAPPLPKEEGGMNIDDIIDGTAPVEDSLYTLDELMSLKKDDIIAIHVKVVKKPYTGKSKGDLAREIIEAQK